MAQKADNIELYRALLDIQKEALELQEENSRLKDKIKQYEENSDIEKKYEYHDGESYYTYKKDDKIIIDICAICWETGRQIVPIIKSGKNYK